MEVKKKAFTLKTVFFKYLLILGVSFIVFAGIYIVICNLGIQNGVLLATKLQRGFG